MLGVQELPSVGRQASCRLLCSYVLVLMCLTNLNHFFNYVYNVYDNCRSADIIYLDFQKAFEKVPHKRLLTKLKAHGVTANIHKWIEN